MIKKWRETDLYKQLKVTRYGVGTKDNLGLAIMMITKFEKL